MTDVFSTVRTEHDAFDPSAVMEDLFVTGDFSVLLRGTFAERVTSGHLDATKRTIYGLSLETIDNPDLEHGLSLSTLIGELVVLHRDGDPSSRAASVGRLAAGEDKEMVITLTGTAHLGTHRPPLHEGDSIEQPGHFEGTLTGEMAGDGDPLYLAGSYVIDSVGAPDDLFDVTGVIEGVALRRQG